MNLTCRIGIDTRKSKYVYKSSSDLNHTDDFNGVFTDPICRSYIVSLYRMKGGNI